ncbi:sensor histidine kinase [Melghirimyces algeriensis]|uniref:histidine kinase n=1 Tax=Melghirimyces algeriensis TaxID=910412 RepID=A0A521ENK0_9BACL|nr:sensor histidine kinase [Melghirimyces algeriensis]SMO85483.1 Signal transduction histidine kinase [Melghirimyces algeriensis]
MKLFLRDQIPLIGFSLAQLATVGIVLRFAGLQSLTDLLYILLLSLAFLGAYMAVRYLSHHDFYHRLSHMPTALDETLRQGDSTPLGTALDDLLERQYRLYQETIHTYERKQRDHVTFITQWVHQMKTPLSVIHLTLQNEESEWASSLREEADRIQRGLDMVLYTARLDVFERDFRVETIHLRELVHDVIQEEKRLFIQNRVYPKLAVDKELRVETDAKWLAFVLKQLISNAVKYSAGSGKNVTIKSYMRGSHAVLEITDQGIGIPEADQRRVFDPYYTGEHGRQYRESTGMGLYLVREVCNRLNHGVELDSKPGLGTSVRIVFISARTNLTQN